MSLQQDLNERWAKRKRKANKSGWSYMKNFKIKAKLEPGIKDYLEVRGFSSNEKGYK